MVLVFTVDGLRLMMDSLEFIGSVRFWFRFSVGDLCFGFGCRLGGGGRLEGGRGLVFGGVEDLVGA